MSNEQKLEESQADFYSSNSFENYRSELVTTIGFLIGLRDDLLENQTNFDRSKLAELRTNEDALIIRHLALLRNLFLKHYEEINKEKFSNITPLDKMGTLLNEESIIFLRERGLETALVNYKNGNNITLNIAYINQYILDNINRIKPLIPEWVKFEYIRNLFLMQGCYAGQKGCNIETRAEQQSIIKKIHTARGKFLSNRYAYPFQTFITWPIDFKEKNGNILFNDAKFLKLLYGANRDIFKATEYVIDAKSESKASIYDFVERAKQIAVFVDCENVDPYCFAATLLNLDSACEISFYIKDSINNSAGGIVGYSIYTDIYECWNCSSVKYASASSESRTLAPRMGNIAGTFKYGKLKDNRYTANVYYGELKVVTWKGGFLNLTTYTWDQRQYVNQFGDAGELVSF